MNRRRAAGLIGALLFLGGGLVIWRLWPAPAPVPLAVNADSVTAAPPAPAPEVAPTPQPVVIQATTSSGIALRIIKPPPLLRPDAPYGPAYQALLPLAESGDQSAQYRLGLLLYECRDVPAVQGELERQISTMQQTRHRGEWDVSDPDIEEDSMRRDFADCDGVPAAARGAYRDWLHQAADAGLMQAQLDLMYHLPQRQYCQYLWQCSPEQRQAQQALQAEALHYVGMAREAGSVSALWTLAAWYQSDEVLPVNDVEAYAHYDALDQIQAAAGLDRQVRPLLNALQNKMRAVDLQQAQVRSREILSNPNCCVLSP